MLNNALAILLQALGAVLFFNRFVAGVRAALHHPDRRADLELPDDAVVVLLSTEGLPA